MQGKIKIIVVDDEFSSRSIVKQYLFGNPHYEVIADFEDGKMAVEWLRDHRADIAVCDMNMPRMDGIEFIEAAKQLHPDMQFLAISGYNDFNYLRECIVHSVSDYLLKHQLTKESLINCLDELCRKNGIVPEGEAADSLPGRLLYGNSCLSDEYLRECAAHSRIDFDFSCMIPLAVSPDYNPNSSYNNETYRLNAKQVIPDLIIQTLGARFQYLVIVTDSMETVVLLSFPSVKSFLYILSASNTLAVRITQRVGRVLDIGVTIGIGSVCVSLTDALAQTQRLRDRLLDKLYLGGSRVFTLDKAGEIKYSSYQLSASDRSQLSCAIENLDFEESEAVIRRIFGEIGKARCSHKNIAHICEQILDILKSPGADLSEYGIRFALLEQAGHFENEILRIVKLCIQKAKNDTRTGYTISVRSTIDFIAGHYCEDISLDQCARNAGLSYTHLSRTFKKETGMGFAEYLNQYRINKAKSLILQNVHTLKEINAMVGFRNYNYFFKVFKELEGVTPNDFLSNRKAGANYCSKL